MNVFMAMMEMIFRIIVEVANGPALQSTQAVQRVGVMV
jgi:hypothetical protein